MNIDIELMREYRKVDDNVTMRLNRTVAQFRDRDRMSSGSVTSRRPEDEACAYFWMDLVCAYTLLDKVATLYSY